MRGMRRVRGEERGEEEGGERERRVRGRTGREDQQNFKDNEE